MHDHVDTKSARYPLLTANVQQQRYFVSHAAPKVVTFGLLTAETRVQSQGVDKSSYSCPVSEYLDMNCDSSVVTDGQKNTTELTGCILKLSIQTFQKFGIFLFTFKYRGQPMDHRQTPSYWVQWNHCNKI